MADQHPDDGRPHQPPHHGSQPLPATGTAEFAAAGAAGEHPSRCVFVASPCSSKGGTAGWAGRDRRR
ncbi:hypothetical protein E2562_019153 [Oryza meyeriana var. granulata]|uniref:Uncharacterized protein n=1 Tax=Oryza meyeriana var. granulata TaxID=110450 RepID=A0A6G1CTC6_9ORYZ|nr:hypothetical protein E2562_019153 [Oryza meyeriana var. granulata]